MVWCQEEPQQHGCLVLRRRSISNGCSTQVGAKHQAARYAGRPASAATGDRADVEAPGAAQLLPRRSVGLIFQSARAAPGLACGNGSTEAGRQGTMTQNEADMTEIRVPTLGESVTEATIGKLVQEGRRPRRRRRAAGRTRNRQGRRSRCRRRPPACSPTSPPRTATPSRVGALLGTIAEGAGAAGRPRPAAAAPEAPPSADPAKAAAPAPDHAAEGPPKAAARRRRTPLGAVRAQARRRERCRCRRPSPGTGKDGRVTKGDMLAAIERAAAPADAGAAARGRRAGACALAGRRCRARRAGADDAAAPDHRPPAQGCAEHRRHADDLQRGRHEPR